MSNPTHFTAWLANDPSCLDGDMCDVTVTEDEFCGYKTSFGGETDEPDWESTTKVLFEATTSVSAEDGDISDAQSEAEDLLWDAGWRTVGDWDVTSSAYTITVERA